MADITHVEVQYVAEDGENKRITLEDMVRHCRAERVGDLLDDLFVLCEDVVDGRHPLDPRPRLSIARGQHRGG